ncbi:hypothetical protein QLH52_00985 [Methylomonas sp. OY6]|uniref:Uncharacterized protein n=1 Tax=Methylomonas defluvii TaxID=3045149 RepID=A0ABU4U9L2_9GAMM|nr:hypothetical protein [Methylomonas sp. OY6]MDX8125846.1 hypothetical protein [Methylomonas sp. OY6]
MPVLITSEATLYTMHESLQSIDARLPAELRLYPRDEKGMAETERLLALLADKLGFATGASPLRQAAASMPTPCKHSLHR